MEKWYKGVYRRQLTDMHINDDNDLYLSKFDENEYFNNLKKARIQSPMIYLQSHTGLCNYPTKVSRTHKAMQGENNKIKRLINLCKADGMKVVGYYSLIFNNVAIEMHPDWEMVTSNGETWRTMGRRYGLCCPNNLEYRAFLDENVKEMAEYFDNLDGAFYDMPYWEIPCACKYCKERFYAETGKEIPTVEDWESENWLLYVKKRQDWMGEFANYTKEISYKYMPNVTCELNFAAVVNADWMAGSTELINDACEFTGGDLYGDLYNHSFTAKYYYGVSKNQPFEYMTCRCNKDLREHTITKTEEMLEKEIMLTLAHHGATLNIDAINPDGTLDGRVYELLGKVFKKQIPYEEYMDKGELYSDIAVYFDARTTFKTPYGDTCNKLCAINTNKTLVENHIATAIISNGNIKNLDIYKMIIAPCLQDFDNDKPLEFINYVKNGGVLYLSGKSDARLVKEFFGAEFVGYTNGDSKFKHVYKGYNEAQAYITPTSDYYVVLDGFNEKYPLPITYKLPLFKNVKGEVKGYITMPYTDPDNNYEFASIHSNPPAYKTEYPAIVEANYGKGKVIWSVAHIENDERINFKNIFINIVKSYVTEKYQIKTNKYVESVIFEDVDKTYITFVDINSYNEIDERQFTLKLPYKVKKVLNITTGKNLEIVNGEVKDKFTSVCMLEIVK